MTGLAQKNNNFFGVASTNCQTGGKNVATDGQYFE